MKRALFLIVANLVFCFSLPAQDLTKGKIVDTKNHGIPYATVRILKNDSTFLLGTTTDSVGVYTFTAPPMDKYLLYVTSIGYESSCISLLKMLFDYSNCIGNRIRKFAVIQVNFLMTYASAFNDSAGNIDFFYDCSG